MLKRSYIYIYIDTHTLLHKATLLSEGVSVPLGALDYICNSKKYKCKSKCNFEENNVKTIEECKCNLQSVGVSPPFQLHVGNSFQKQSKV